MCSGIYSSRLLVIAGISIRGVYPSLFLYIEIKGLEYIARKRLKNIR
jgi:hypothetical protein